MTVHFPADRDHQPRGIYRAVSCRDAASTARDGETIYDLNHLTTADGRPECEVLFGDGTWLLADTEQDIVPAFSFDAWPDRHFAAQGYGSTWNGWDTPAVTRATLEAICALVGADLQWEGVIACLTDGEGSVTLLESDSDGNYSFVELGWTPLKGAL